MGDMLIVFFGGKWIWASFWGFGSRVECGCLILVKFGQFLTAGL